MGGGNRQQHAVAQQSAERRRAERSPESDAIREIRTRGAPARRGRVGGVHIFAARHGKGPGGDGGKSFEQFEESFPGNHVANVGDAQWAASPRPDCIGSGEDGQGGSGEPVPPRRNNDRRQPPSGELPGRFHAGPTWGKDAVGAPEIGAFFFAKPPSLRFSPLGFRALRMVDECDDARSPAAPGDVAAQEFPVQQFVLQDHVRAVNPIRLGLSGKGELADPHRVAPGSQGLGQHPVVEVSTGKRVEPGSPDFDPERHGVSEALSLAFRGPHNSRLIPPGETSMKRKRPASRFQSVLVLFVALPGWGCAPEPTVPDADFAIVSATVLPMDSERALSEHTVIVRDGRVAAVLPATEVTLGADTAVISGAGRFVIPGLAEMHGHLPGANSPPALTEDVLMLYVANGVTTVRGMQGHQSQLALRDRIEARELIGPRLVVGSPSMSGRIETPEEAVRLVREYHEAGFDLLKVHEGLAPETYRALAETAREVGIPFAGHVSDEVGLLAALEAGQDTVDHLDNFVEALIPEEARGEMEALRGIAGLSELVDLERLPAVIEAFQASGAGVVPTIVLWESGILPTRSSGALKAERPEIRYLPADTVARWAEAVDSGLERYGAENTARIAALRRQILGALHEAGALILLGTDSPQIFSVPGFSIHREAMSYVEAGMTPYEVLESGTRLVSEHLARNGRIADDFGVVASGKRADLVLLESNPLEDIGATREIAGVVAGGRYLSAADIAANLAAIAARRSTGE